MVSLKFVIFVVLAVLVVISAKKPRRRSKFTIKILSINQTSITARFTQHKRVKKYFVSISVKGLADVSSHYWTDIKRPNKTYVGDYEINSGNTLQAGTLYEMDVINKNKRFNQIGTIDFFTDCDEYGYKCDTIYDRPACLTSSSLCDGHQDCISEEDEKTNEDGSCVITLPERPTPPPPSPPPADAPCILELERAVAESRTPLPECDQNGMFSAMQCFQESVFTCNCTHPETGDVLRSQPDFHPFVQYDFSDNCNELIKKTLKEATP